MNNVLNFSTLLFFQSIFLIQLFEYFVWSKTLPNRLLSQFGLGIIILQPIFSIFLIPESSIYRQILMIAYLLFIAVLYLVITPLDKIDFKTVPHENGHLAWNWIPSNEFAIIWSIFLILPTLLKKWYGSFLGLITFIITYVLYSDTKTWGSLWCWAINIIGVFLIFFVFWKDFCKIPNIWKKLRSIFTSKISPDFVR